MDVEDVEMDVESAEDDVNVNDEVVEAEGGKDKDDVVALNDLVEMSSS